MRPLNQKNDSIYFLDQKNGLAANLVRSVGRLCDKRKIISVFTKIIHLPLEILLLVIPVVNEDLSVWKLLYSKVV